MKKAADIKMHPKSSTTKLQQGKVKVTPSTAFTPFEIQQLANDKEKSKKTAAEATKKRKLEAEAVAHQKDEAKQVAEAKRVARSCAAPSCTKISRFQDGAKSWHKCINCEKLFCKEHTREYQEHVKVCNLVDDSDSETSIVAL